MTMRPFTDMRAGLNHIVDAQIGRAFPVVHKVYEHLDAIEYIAQVYESGRSRDIVLRTNHTKEWIEWQYKGEDTWTILFKFSDLLGADIANVVAAEQAIAAELVALRVHIDQARSDTLDASNRAQAAELEAVNAKNAAEVAQASAHASAQSAADHQTATEVAATTGAQHLVDIEAQVVAAEAFKQETVAAHQAGLAAKASAEEAAVNAATFAENADVSAAESATSANEAEASANAAELSAQNAAAHKAEAENQAVAAEASALASAASATVSSEKLGELILLHDAVVTASTTATEAAETVTTHLAQVTALHSATESFAQAAQASAIQADSAATAAGVSASAALQLRNETQGFHDAASTMVVDAAQVSADRATVQTLAQEVQLAADQAQSNALAAADSANAANDSATIAQTSASEILGQVATVSGRLDEADSIVTTVTALRDETLSYKLAVEDSTVNAQAVAADRAAVADMMGTIAADAASAADSKDQALAAAATAAQAEAAANTAITVAQSAAQEVVSNTTAAQDAAAAALSSQTLASDSATQAAASFTAVVPLHTEVVTKHAEVLVRADQVAEDLLAADASKGAAEIAQADAETAEALARAWATKIDGPVLNDGGDKFSAQYWATQAEQSAVVAADANTGVLGALSNHTAEADPHTQYLTKAESIHVLATKLDVNDLSVTNAREWTASEVSQAEAEAGTATIARKWTAQHVRQAITGWWSGIGTAFGKSLLSLADAAAGRTALGLENVNNTSDANKSVASAAKLTTARTINGVSFDGTTDITVADTTKEPAFVAGTAAQYFRGDKTWRDLATDVRAAPLTGLSTATNTAITASDTVLSAPGKLQAQITELDFEKLSQSGGTMTGALTLPDNGLVVGTTQIVASGGNVGLGAAVPKAPLHSFNAFNLGNPDTTGTGTTGVSARIQGGSVNMDFGVYSSGNTWIQSRLNTDNSFTLQLVLNPVGGPVVVGSGGLGYATGIGAGGAVEQPTSKGTAVTLNKPTGHIALANTAMGANTTSGFTLNNSVIESHDVVIVSVHSGAADPANYQVWTAGGATGACSVYIRNISAGILSESVVLKFAVIKGATA